MSDEFDLSLIVRGVDQGASETGRKVATSLDDIVRSSRAANAAAGTFSTGMTGAAHTARLSALQIRESLVLAREAASGNFTRMAGSVSILAGSLASSGKGVGQYVKDLLSMVGVLKVTQNAELAEAAANAAASAESIAGAGKRAAANILAADTELALAQAAVRTAATSEEEALAQEALAKAHQSVAAAATEAAIAEDALAIAQGRAGEANAASLAATTTRLGTLGVALGIVATVGAVAFGAIHKFQGEVKDSKELDKYRASLGLTHKEMLKLDEGVQQAGKHTKELGPITVSVGDVLKGVWKSVTDDIAKTRFASGEGAGTWSNFKKNATDAFDAILEGWNIAAAGITAGIYGTFNAVKVVWKNFPAVFGDLFVQGVNAAIQALNGLVKKGTDQVNSFIASVNSVLGTHLGSIAGPQIGLLDNANAGAASRAAKQIKDGYHDAYTSARKDDADFWHRSERNAVKFRKDHMDDERDALVADRSPKRGKKAKKAKDPFALDEFGRDAENKILGLAEGFVDVPAQVEKVNKALRQLDDLVDDIQHKKPPNMKQLLEDAAKARDLIINGINKPFNDFLIEQGKSLEVAKLIAVGRKDEADALQIIQTIEKAQGPLDEAHRESILASVQALKLEQREADILREKQQKYLDLVSSVRDAVKGVLSTDPVQGLKDLPNKIINAVNQERMDAIFDKLFAPAFQKLQDKITGNTIEKDAATRMAVAVDAASAANKRAAAAVADLGSAASGAASALRSGSSGSGLGNSLFPVGADGVDPLAALPDGANDNSPITVTGQRPTNLAGILQGLSKGIGISDAGAKKIGEIGGKAFSGAATGALTDSFLKPLGKALGFKTSKTGSEIGGAIGSFLPIPGGDIIGSIIGSIVGGLFKKSKYATATISGSGGALDVGAAKGRGSSQIDAANSLGGGVGDAISQIAQSLGGSIGDFAISIGVTKKGKFVVDEKGLGRTKTGRGPDDTPEFKTQEEATTFAIMYAVQHGAVAGLSAAVQQALKSSTDINKGLAEALKVKDLETLIGGIGNQFEQMFRAEDTAAAERVRLAKTYGLDLVKVEKLNGERRAALLDDLLKQSLGNLQDLQKSLLFGDLSEGDASTRRNALLDQITATMKDAENGVAGATDDLSSLFQRLIGTSKEAFGTAGPEYSSDRNLVTSGLDHIIQVERDRIEKAAAYQDATLTAANTNNALTNETNDLLAQQNALIGQLLSSGGGGSVGGGYGLLAGGGADQLYRASAF